MPNHVTTILSIEDAAGRDLSEIRKAFVNDKGFVDLDVVLPKPACLKDFDPHMGILERPEQAPMIVAEIERLDRAEARNVGRAVSSLKSEKGLARTYNIMTNKPFRK